LIATAILSEFVPTPVAETSPVIMQGTSAFWATAHVLSLVQKKPPIMQQKNADMATQIQAYSHTIFFHYRVRQGAEHHTCPLLFL